VHEEVQRRGLAVAVIGIPKTIDNDIAFVKQTFGLETAFAVAGEAIRSAHIEAKGAPNGVGIVKVMGRSSGFIAANAALALNDVNYVLVPEVPFDLEGPRGLFRVLDSRLRRKKHAVIVVAEGAGQKYVASPDGRRDESGNPLLGDIGSFLAVQIKRYFKENTDLYVNIKYIDPSYLVRSVPANAHDAIFCMRLGQNAVHAGMAGKTAMLVSRWHGHFVHVPIKATVGKTKEVDLDSPLWRSVLESTGQPPLKNA
jgi:6-phosphofructokinase 1